MSIFPQEKRTIAAAVPMMLKDRWTTDTRFAELFILMQESIAVMQVPIFCPVIMGIAAPKDIVPVSATACRMPTEAEED